ncbi:MAG: response regulator transcription factor [Acidimicrobiia bacterium]
MAEPTILVVEDDDAIGKALVGALTAQGFRVDLTASGNQALASSVTERPDLVLLDLGLPDLDGVEVCRRLRALDESLPIVILTARHSEIDVALDLDAGANDYVTKPFRLAELLARVRAHLRRSVTTSATTRIELGDVVIDRDARRVFVGSEEVDLRAREYELFVFLAEAAGSAVTRERIMTEVWDSNWFGSTKTLDMHISSLRRKLSETVGGEGAAGRITTLRGVGYRFEL